LKWELKLDTSGEVPQGREDHSAVLVKNLKMVIMGGICRIKKTNFSDIHIYYIDANHW